MVMATPDCDMALDRAVHLLCAAPSQWAGFWPELTALLQPQDAVVLLGEARAGAQDPRLQGLPVLGLFDPADPAAPAPAPAPASATAVSARLPQLTAVALAGLVLQARQVLTWR